MLSFLFYQPPNMAVLTICQGSQNGSPPDVDGRGGHPGPDGSPQLQHGGKPTPEGLLLKVHHLETWPPLPPFTLDNTAASPPEMPVDNHNGLFLDTGGDHVDWLIDWSLFCFLVIFLGCIVFLLLLILSFLERDWNPLTHNPSLVVLFCFFFWRNIVVPMYVVDIQPSHHLPLCNCTDILTLLSQARYCCPHPLSSIWRSLMGHWASFLLCFSWQDTYVPYLTISAVSTSKHLHE